MILKQLHPSLFWVTGLIVNYYSDTDDLLFVVVSTFPENLHLLVGLKVSDKSFLNTWKDGKRFTTAM